MGEAKDEDIMLRQGAEAEVDIGARVQSPSQEADGSSWGSSAPAELESQETRTGLSPAPLYMKWQLMNDSFG